MSKSVFLSYARGDGEPFVARLHADLAGGCDVWWDRVSMPACGLRRDLEKVRRIRTELATRKKGQHCHEH